MASYTYSFPLRSCFMMRLRQTNVHSKFCDCLCRCCSVIGVVAGSPSKYSRHYPLQTHQRAVPNAARWNTKNMDFPTITDIHGNARLSYGSTTRERLISHWFFLLEKRPQQIIWHQRIVTFGKMFCSQFLYQLSCHMSQPINYIELPRVVI